MDASLCTFIGTCKPISCANMDLEPLHGVRCANFHCKKVQVVCIFLGSGAAFVPLGHACLKACRSVSCLVHHHLSEAVSLFRALVFRLFSDKPLILIALAWSCRWWRLQ